jgi:arylsulfatase A-like enzyme
MRTSNRREALLGGAAVVLATFAPAAAKAAKPSKPNIVLIYTDDLGYGDIGCYGAKGLKTPNIDRLAAQGITFANGHAPSATCTPSRYALLTGQYAWRKEGAQILPGDAPALILPGRKTLPAMLKSAGYATAVVGKWHLGLGSGTIDWNGDIAPGPLEIGFDYGYFIPATIDRVPTVYVENHRVVGLEASDPIKVDYHREIGSDPTGLSHPELARMKADPEHSGTIVNKVSRIGHMTGGAKAHWVDEEMADHLTRKAVDYIEANAKGPFFLYFATNEVHVPRMPAARFVGKSGMGPRGDSILELDWIVGEVMGCLDRLGIANSTIVMFSSDNGPILFDGYEDEAVERANGHRPAGPYASGKYSALEGGTRVPLIARWPGHIPAGMVSDALIDHVDLYASLAALTGQSLAGDAAPDSFNVLPALLGQTKTGRDYAIEDTKLMVTNGATVSGSGDRVLAIVEGDWKLIKPSVPPAEFHGNAIGSSLEPQLYNLKKDPGERVNLAAKYPARVKAMQARLDKVIAAGRSRV